MNMNYIPTALCRRHKGVSFMTDRWQTHLFSLTMAHNTRIQKKYLLKAITEDKSDPVFLGKSFLMCSKNHSAPSGSSIKKYGTKNVCYIGMADVCSQWTTYLYMNTRLLHGYCSWTV